MRQKIWFSNGNNLNWKFLNAQFHLQARFLIYLNLFLIAGSIKKGALQINFLSNISIRGSLGELATWLASSGGKAQVVAAEAFSAMH